MTKILFVGGLPYNLTSSQLEEMFSQFGQVASTKIITDNLTGQSKGFGFVEMSEDTDANQAIAKLNNSEINGRRISVSIARPREERPKFENRNNYRNDFKKTDKRNRN